MTLLLRCPPQFPDPLPAHGEGPEQLVKRDEDPTVVAVEVFVVDHMESRASAGEDEPVMADP